MGANFKGIALAREAFRAGAAREIPGPQEAAQGGGLGRLPTAIHPVEGLFLDSGVGDNGGRERLLGFFPTPFEYRGIGHTAQVEFEVEEIEASGAAIQAGLVIVNGGCDITVGAPEAYFGDPAGERFQLPRQLLAVGWGPVRTLLLSRRSAGGDS